MIETVWLDNPPVNAVNSGIIDTLWTAFENLDDGVNAVVLRGKGERVFVIAVLAAGDRPDQRARGVVLDLANLLHLGNALGDKLLLESRHLRVARGALAERGLIGAEQLHEESAENAADVDEQRRLLRLLESAVRDAVAAPSARRG